MAGVLYIEDAKVEATSGHMLVTFTSGGEAFRFHLPGHIALGFREHVMRDAWQVCCPTTAQVVALKPARATKRHGHA